MTIPEEFTHRPTEGGWPPPGDRQQYSQPQYGPQYGQTEYGQPQYGQPQYGQPEYGQSEFYQPQYQRPSRLRRGGGRRVAAVVGGGLAVLVLGGAGGFAAGWSAHSASAAQQSTAGSTSPYLPLAPGNGSGSQSGGGTGSGGTGSGTNGSGSGATGATDSQVAAVAAKVDPALVDIDTVLGAENGEAAGTGIVIGSTGVILTNNHVVAGATSITVTDLGNSKQYRAAVVGYDRTGDIAVLQLSGASGLATATLADAATVKAGDPVVAIGNAGGTGGTPSAVGGAVSALNQSITASDESSGASEQLTGLIEVNADIQAGDSGGPLLTTSGQVIGVDTAASAGFQYQASGGDGFAIPIGTATTIADQIRAGQASSKIHLGATAYLGIETSGSSSGYQSVAGPVVLGVVADSPADSVGLTRGDVITSVAGTKVDSATTLTNLLDGYHPGDHVKVAWTDLSGQSHTGTVKLATGPVG
jgi:S1-C subfamily serine protease